MSNPTYPEFSFTYRGIKVSLDWIGEGYSGDYDPADPDDAPLYRLEIWRGGTNGYGDSACTCIVAGLDGFDYEDAVRRIAKDAHARHYDGHSLQAIVEDLSWFSNDDIIERCPA